MLLAVGIGSLFVSLWLFWLARPRGDSRSGRGAGVRRAVEVVAAEPVTSLANSAASTARILYGHGADDVTERDIRIDAVIDVGSDLKVEAFCLLRREPRTFMASRIQTLVDLTTGEVIEDIFGYLVAGRPLPGPVVASRLASRLSEELTVLMFVAEASGRISPARQKAILTFARAQEDAVASDEELWAALRRRRPSYNDFRLTLTDASEWPWERRQPLLQAISALPYRKIDEFAASAIGLARRALIGRVC
jgi:hypothetical protein